MHRNEEEEARHRRCSDECQELPDPQLAWRLLEHRLRSVQELCWRCVLVVAHEDVQHRKWPLHAALELRPAFRVCSLECLPTQAEEAPPPHVRPRVWCSDSAREFAAPEVEAREARCWERLLDDLPSVTKRSKKGSLRKANLLTLSGNRSVGTELLRGMPVCVQAVPRPRGTIGGKPTGLLLRASRLPASGDSRFRLLSLGHLSALGADQMLRTPKNQFPC